MASGATILDRTQASLGLEIKDHLSNYIGQPNTADNRYTMANTAATMVDNFIKDSDTTTYDASQPRLTNISSGDYIYGIDRAGTTSTSVDFTATYTNSSTTIASIIRQYGLTETGTGTENLFNLGYSTYLQDNPCFNLVFPYDKGTLLREDIRRNLAPAHIKRIGAIPLHKVPDNEAVALESLREVVTETEFRRYLKYGFVLVRGKSGDTFQVFRNGAHTKVWRGGKLIEEICVRIGNIEKCPPTDNVIAFKTMIESDENEFKKTGNLYNMQYKRAA